MYVWFTLIHLYCFRYIYSNCRKMLHKFTVFFLQSNGKKYNAMNVKKNTKTLGWVLVRLHGTWGDSLSGWGSCGKCFGILNIFSSCLWNANYFCNVCRNILVKSSLIKVLFREQFFIWTIYSTGLSAWEIVLIQISLTWLFSDHSVDWTKTNHQQKTKNQDRRWG